MIKNIVFDIGNVLVRFQPDEAMREIGIEENKIAALAHATYENPVWVELDRGVIPENEIIDEMVIQGVMWMFTLWIGKSTAEVLNLNGPAKLLENISSVFSTLIAVLLCIMSIYILSTAAVIMLGGGSS